MKSAGNLQNMVLLSFIVHVMVIGFSSVAFKKMHPLYVPSVYKVNIVTPHVRKRTVTKPVAEKPAEVKKAPPKEKAVKKIEPKPVKKAVEKEVSPMLTKEKTKMIDKSIERILEKKKGEKIGELESMINSSIKKLSEQDVEEKEVGEGAVEAEGDVVDAGGVMAQYLSDIGRQIRAAWAYPGLANRDLVTIVSITISMTGNINIIGVEESSGNDLFDKSVVRAIRKASPVKKPPYEWADKPIGLRFHP